MGELLFPNAKYIVGESAWERCINPHKRDKASFVPGLAEQLSASRRLLIIKGRSIPGVLENILSFHYTDGHTPGQMHTYYWKQKKSFFCGDLIPGIAWLRIPITMGYDRFPEKLIDEKAQILDLCQKENWLLLFTHDPSCVACDYKKTEDKDKGVKAYEVLNKMLI